MFVLVFKICFCIRVLFGYIWSIKDLIFSVKKTKIYYYIIIDHYWPYWSWLFIFLFSFFSNIVWIFHRKSLSLMLYFSLALENVQFACVFLNMACFFNFIIFESQIWKKTQIKCQKDNGLSRSTTKKNSKKIVLTSYLERSSEKNDLLYLQGFKITGISAALLHCTLCLTEFRYWEAPPDNFLFVTL